MDFRSHYCEIKPEGLEPGETRTFGTYEEIKDYVQNKHGLKVSTSK